MASPYWMVLNPSPWFFNLTVIREVLDPVSIVYVTRCWSGIDSLLSFFDQALHGSTTVCCSCLSSETQSYRSKNCTLTTSVMTNYKVDKGTKFYFEPTMTLLRCE